MKQSFFMALVAMTIIGGLRAQDLNLGVKVNFTQEYFQTKFLGINVLKNEHEYTIMPYVSFPFSLEEKYMYDTRGVGIGLKVRKNFRLPYRSNLIPFLELDDEVFCLNHENRNYIGVNTTISAGLTISDDRRVALSILAGYQFGGIYRHVDGDYLVSMFGNSGDLLSKDMSGFVATVMMTFSINRHNWVSRRRNRRSPNYFPRRRMVRYQFLAKGVMSVSGEEIDGGIQIALNKRKLRREHWVDLAEISLYQSGALDFLVGKKWYVNKSGTKNQVFVSGGLWTKVAMNDGEIAAVGTKVKTGVEFGIFSTNVGIGVPMLGVMAHKKTYLQFFLGFGVKF